MLSCNALSLADNSGLVKRNKNKKIPLWQVTYTSLPREDIAPGEGTKALRRTLYFVSFMLRTGFSFLSEFWTLQLRKLGSAGLIVRKESGGGGGRDGTLGINCVFHRLWILRMNFFACFDWIVPSFSLSKSDDSEWHIRSHHQSFLPQTLPKQPSDGVSAGRRCGYKYRRLAYFSLRESLKVLFVSNGNNRWYRGFRATYTQVNHTGEL